MCRALTQCAVYLVQMESIPPSSRRLKTRNFVSLDSCHRFLRNFVSSKTFRKVSSLRTGTNRCNRQTCINQTLLSFLPPWHRLTRSPHHRGHHHLQPCPLCSRLFRRRKTRYVRLVAAAEKCLLTPINSCATPRNGSVQQQQNPPRNTFTSGKRTSPAFRPTGTRGSTSTMV
jgi:hypothetical protein